MFPPCLKSQGCHLIPLFSLLSCYIATQCCFSLFIWLLLAHSACSPEIYVIFFFWRQAFSYYMPLVFRFVYALGDENQLVMCAVWCLMALVFASYAFRDINKYIFDFFYLFILFITFCNLVSGIEKSGLKGSMIAAKLSQLMC